MIPIWIMWVNVAWYTLLMLFYAAYRAWAVASYWAGAAIITIAVIMMAKGYR